MVADSNTQHLQGISQLLILEQLLEKEKALDYQQKAYAGKTSLLRYLVHHHILSAADIACATAKHLGVPIVDLDCIELDLIPSSLVSEKLIRRHHMIPLFNRGKHLYLATDDPGKQASLKEIQFHTGLHTNPIVVETDKLDALIEKLLMAKESRGLHEYVDESSEMDSLRISADETESALDSSASITDDAPVVKFVNKILLDAVKQSASDIHFEPYEGTYRIRYRQDGILNEVANPPIKLSSRITARIKVMSNLDISERRVPQDGRFKMNLTKAQAIDFRVSTCPTIGGEKVVIRILDSSTAKLSIEALGFNELQKSDFLRAIGRPQGMILVTGPTGSGKTVTLYTAMNSLNSKEINISTAEDPVEINIAGINQVNINLKAGLTFSKALRSFLRQDPDIIMVGEIRDLETAEIAVKAAQTGHLVLSTLHTNSASETLTRMVNMGIPSFNIASSVSLIIAQRLARRLCDQCKIERNDMTKKALLELGFSEEETALPTFRPVGCNQCNKGYNGRVGLFEVMPMSKAIGAIIMAGGTSLDILQQGQKEGMLTVYQSGINKVLAGITTIEEIARVTVD